MEGSVRWGAVGGSGFEWGLQIDGYNGADVGIERFGSRELSENGIVTHSALLLCTNRG